MGTQESKSLVRQQVRTIFQEDGSEVKNEMLRILPKIIDLYQADMKNNKQFFGELLKEFLEIIETKYASANWRFLENLILLIENNFALFDSS